jgi:RHS repeat-associated protein
VRTFTYTNAGLATAANALGHTIGVGRSPNGAITSMTTPRQKTYIIGRNDYGDATSIRNPLNHTTTYEVDSMGRTAAVVTPMLHRTAIRYDRRGRVTGVRLPTGAEWGIRHDRGGRVVERTDALGRKTRHAYDTYGRLASVTDPLQGTTRFTYDIMSRLTGITDANGRTTRRQIDAYGRVTRVTFPDDRFESYTYYADGRLHTVTDRKGVVTTFHRDELGRLTERTFSDGSPSVTYHYDPRGRLDSAANGADTLTWGYDDADRLLSEGSSFNGSAVSYSYDDDGHRRTVSLDSVELATYDWDDASRFTSLGWGGHTFGFDYDHDGRRRLLTYPNGVSTTYGYDDDARLRTLSTALNQTVLSGAAYTHDAVGNRLSKTTPLFAEAYVYDALDRLVNVERTAGGPSHGHFAYDPVGNRLRDQVDDAVATMVFDEGNRALSRTGGGTLTVRGQLDEPGQVKVNGQAVGMMPGNVFETDLPAVAGDNDFAVEARDVRGNLRTGTYRVNVPAATITYAHDDNGNLAQAVESTGTWTYEWTAENQLRRVRRDGVEVARFAYDPMGRRIEKVAGGTTIRFAYDGVDILRETRSGAESGVYRHVHGPGIDEPLATQDGLGTSYHHADGLGSIVATTDAAGTVTSRRQYDAWGRMLVGAERPGYAFTGREWDPETGLYYYRARYYDPRIGRFLSEDPIGFAGGLNLYSYVANDPVARLDPSGENPIVVVVAGAAIVVGAIAVVSPNFREWLGFTGQESFEEFAGEVSHNPFIDLVTSAHEIAPYMESQIEEIMVQRVFSCMDRPWDPNCTPLMEGARDYCKVRRPKTSQGQQACEICAAP